LQRIEESIPLATSSRECACIGTFDHVTAFKSLLLEAALERELALSRLTVGRYGGALLQCAFPKAY
jgi:hypothetical protein